MKLRYESQKDLERQILKIIKSYLNLDEYCVFFFGSRVAGGGDERSDVDVGIEGESPVPLPVMARIQEEISDLPILYRIDLVDFKAVGETFRHLAKQAVEVISPG